jgi:hypothetical protein
LLAGTGSWRQPRHRRTRTRVLGRWGSVIIAGTTRARLCARHSRRADARARKSRLGLVQDRVEKVGLFWARHDKDGTVAVRQNGDAAVSGGARKEE